MKHTLRVTMPRQPTTSPSVERPISTNGPLVTSDRGSTPPSDRSNSSSGLDGLRELVRRSRLKAKSRIQSHSPDAPSVARSSASEVENDLMFPSLVYPDAELSASDILDTREPSRDVVRDPSHLRHLRRPMQTLWVPVPEDESALESVPDITNAVEDESEFELEYWDGPGKLNFPLLPVGLQKKPESIQTSGTADADIAPTSAIKTRPNVIKTLGGNPVFTWQDVVSDPANFKQPCKLAKNIPHSLQDYINRMDAWHRSLPGMRTVLEAAIGENTAEDEPNAPPISIVNNFDDEPCPPGNSTTPTSCGMMKKQRSWSGEFTPDFAYDSRGRLKYQNVPIFECNDMCGCDDDCRNRVVQHGRKCAVQIGKTKNKGWGVFAGPKKIYDGTFLGIYSGELLTEEVAEERGKEGKEKEEGKEEEWEPKYVVDAYHAGNEEDLEEQAERVVKGDAIYERCMCGAKNCTGTSIIVAYYLSDC
ncbi:SET domain-containing protein [Salix suchowensis]|nr:SET domain-containing protein [Salix suchowensis]